MKKREKRRHQSVLKRTRSESGICAGCKSEKKKQRQHKRNCNSGIHASIITIAPVQRNNCYNYDQFTSTLIERALASTRTQTMLPYATSELAMIMRNCALNQRRNDTNVGKLLLNCARYKRRPA